VTCGSEGSAGLDGREPLVMELDVDPVAPRRLGDLFGKRASEIGSSAVSTRQALRKPDHHERSSLLMAQ